MKVFQFILAGSFPPTLLLRGERWPAWLTPVFACERCIKEERNPGNYYKGKEGGNRG